MIRIYCQTPIITNTVYLDKTSSHHLLNVLRKKVGDPVVLFDGTGVEFHGSIGQIEKKIATVNITDKLTVDREATRYVHLGQALAKGERMDFVMQKSVELGVAEITPILTERSNVKLDAARSEKRLAHWRAVIISACEQCGRNIIPRLNPITPLANFIKNNPHQGLILHPEQSLLISNINLSDYITLLVGPEGGFSYAEVKLANQANFTSLSLGKRILRTETASLAALSLLN